MNRDSGTLRGRRMIVGGRARGAFGVVHGGAVGGAVSTRPSRRSTAGSMAAGKPTKVALTAAARKLLTIADAILRSKRPWDPAKAGSQA